MTFLQFWFLQYIKPEEEVKTDLGGCWFFAFEKRYSEFCG